MNSHKKVIINLAHNKEQVEKLKGIFNTTNVSVYDSMEKYLGDGHMLIDKSIRNWKDLFYADYIDRKESVFVITDMGKKSWRKYAKQTINSQFYLVKMFRIQPMDTKEKIILKLQQYKENNKLDFFRHYLRLVESVKPQEFTAYAEVATGIELCPYCKGKQFKIHNEVEEIEKSGKNIDEYFGWFDEYIVCTQCDKKIISTPIMHRSG